MLPPRANQSGLDMANCCWAFARISTFTYMFRLHLRLGELYSFQRHLYADVINEISTATKKRTLLDRPFLIVVAKQRFSLLTVIIIIISSSEAIVGTLSR